MVHLTGPSKITTKIYHCVPFSLPNLQQDVEQKYVVIDGVVILASPAIYSGNPPKISTPYFLATGKTFSISGGAVGAFFSPRA